MEHKYALKDYGYPEYLDGAKMQFVLEDERGWTMAYIGDKDLARKITKLLNKSKEDK